MALCGALLRAACVVLVAAGCSQAYYLPGTYPQEFSMGQTIQGEQALRRACPQADSCHRRSDESKCPSAVTAARSI